MGVGDLGQGREGRRCLPLSPLPIVGEREGEPGLWGGGGGPLFVRHVGQVAVGAVGVDVVKCGKVLGCASHGMGLPGG